MAQCWMNKAPSETQTHSRSFTRQACKPLHYSRRSCHDHVCCHRVTKVSVFPWIGAVSRENFDPDFFLSLLSFFEQTRPSVFDPLSWSETDMFYFLFLFHGMNRLPSPTSARKQLGKKDFMYTFFCISLHSVCSSMCNYFFLGGGYVVKCCNI